jgi:lipoprotein-anchoring transpeptidase ErfK/SrfK
VSLAAPLGATFSSPAPTSNHRTPATGVLLDAGTSRGHVLPGHDRRPPAKPARASTRPAPATLVQVSSDLTARAWPHADARVVGTVPDGSRFYGVPTTAWIEEISRDGRWGLVEIPYVFPRRDGWIRLGGLRRDSTAVQVHVDLSEHELTVTKRGDVVLHAPAATGAPASPTPPGRYFVTDRISFAPGGPLGSFAFGISGIQPNLPAGWTGGDQLAIHGTDTPTSIGTSASAGCMRVAERTLDRLKPLLRLGTPVIVRP